jgi:hypothetical protein
MNTKRTKGSNCAETEPKKGWVYFIRSGKAIKIGFTTDLDQRVRRLQTASSAPLELLGTVAGTLEDEQNLHRRFANLQLRGEWFRGHSSLMAYIREATEIPEPAAAPEPEEPVQPLPPETRAAIRGLLKRRNEVGAETRQGYHLSNLIEQMRNYARETDPTARAHLERFMGWSVEAIARSA